MKHLPLLAALVFTVISCSHRPTKNITFHRGTTIIAFIKPDTAWIAADRKVSVNDGSSYSAVKIHESDGIVYAFHNLPQVYLDNIVIFDAIKTLELCIKKEKELQKSYALFKPTIFNEMNNLIMRFKKEGRNEALEALTKKTMFGVFMITYKNGVQEDIYGQYRFKKTTTNLIYPIEEVEPVSQDNNRIRIFGESDSIWSYLTAHPSYFRGFSQMQKKLTCLIDMEAQHKPETVGLPVDFVMMTKAAGNQWRFGINGCNSLR